ncbi:Oxidoreductase [uncultured Gammaproteobacteria bacterium]
MSRLSGRIALITGASRGIGAAVAKRFAAEGAQVILTARTTGALEEVDDAIRAAGGLPATIIPLDLTQHAQLDVLGGAVFQNFGRLDILVGNAGVLGGLGPVALGEPDTWQEAMAVNLIANQRLIRTLDPLLRGGPAGRAIFVTSGAASTAFPYWGAYGASKAALEMMVRCYAAEVVSTNLKVNLLDPGVVRTALRAQAFPGEDATMLRSPETITGRFVELAEIACTRHGQLVRA